MMLLLLLRDDRHFNWAYNASHRLQNYGQAARKVSHDHSDSSKEFWIFGAALSLSLTCGGWRVTCFVWQATCNTSQGFKTILRLMMARQSFAKNSFSSLVMKSPQTFSYPLQIWNVHAPPFANSFSQTVFTDLKLKLNFKFQMRLKCKLLPNSGAIVLVCLQQFESSIDRIETVCRTFREKVTACTKHVVKRLTQFNINFIRCYRRWFWCFAGSWANQRLLWGWIKLFCKTECPWEPSLSPGPLIAQTCKIASM